MAYTTSTAIELQTFFILKGLSSIETPEDQDRIPTRSEDIQDPLFPPYSFENKTPSEQFP